MNYGDFPLGETIHVLFTTRAFATGIPGTLSAATVAVYEDITSTPIQTSVAVTESLNSIAGLNAVPIVATGGNGYELGKNYHVVLEAGDVDSVSTAGEVIAYFSIGRSAAAVDLANGTDGLTALKTAIDLLATTADLLDKLGAVDEAAAVADPSTTESVMQYVKQIVNLLAGSAGIGTMPTGLDPANGVNLFEMVHAGLGATFATATDSNEQLQIDIAAIPTTTMRGTDNAATATNLATLTDAFILTSATIETVTSQTQFVIPATADAVEDQAYHGAIAVFIDNDDANNKSFQVIETYTASSRTVVVARAPTFTVTTSDTITILATTDAGGVWDMALTGSKHNIATSAGKRLRQLEEAFVHASGTVVNVGDGHTITLDGGAVGTAAYYVGDRLQITEGTGLGQSRLIIKYTASKVATLDSDWITNPDTNSLYDVVAADVHVSVSDSDLAEGFVATATSTTTITLDSTIAVATADYYVGDLIIFTHGTGAGQSREITAYTSGRVVTMSPALATAVSTDTVWHIQAMVSIPEIVDEVLDEALSGHTTAGTLGKAVTDIEVDTAEIGTAGASLTDLGGMSSGMKNEVNAEVDTAFTTQLADSVPAQGTRPTREEAIYMIGQFLMERSVSSTTVTVNKVDGSTELMTFTLDDATSPTSHTRAS